MESRYHYYRSRKIILEKILKLDGFCCILNHLEYDLIIENFYNTYNELDVKPIDEKLTLQQMENNIPNSLNFIRHVFGEHYEFGLDYIKILYEKPTQTLPILCLISKERATGKSSFIKWMKSIFGLNMTYIKGDAFNSQFNSDWASMVLVAMMKCFSIEKRLQSV